MKTCFSIILILSGFLCFSQTPEDTIQQNQKTIYLFSGIGADSSPFSNLDLPGYNKVYISWIPPLPDETLAHYAGRLKEQITVKNPYIIGLSFGGMVAVEVSKQIEVEKMVLISSARTKDDLSRFQAFFMRLGLYKIIPGSFLRHTNFLTYTYFGTHTPTDKKALTHLLNGTDIKLFRWALKSIAFWDNVEMPERTIEIHGTADKIIACRLSHPDYKIKGGGHLMVYNKADTISKIIMNYFRD
ncbi:alpha/beta hydrolase [Taibaiella lutea]|uniref:Alpha/beta hydrolase n=1 Tax=Taibaiella lutea TaxID=2608001 RepID=A0A5M6CST9_9BACT|nr:alpha/beta hydrolase [Taibaiella lutea]KAA5536105.1 alpha/beta hydrolase [Taibaiella lutea]